MPQTYHSQTFHPLKADIVEMSWVSAARSGGVSRSDCRHVLKITTPYKLRALIWDYLVDESIEYYVTFGSLLQSARFRLVATSARWYSTVFWHSVQFSVDD